MASSSEERAPAPRRLRRRTHATATPTDTVERYDNGEPALKRIDAHAPVDPTHMRLVEELVREQMGHDTTGEGTNAKLQNHATQVSKRAKQSLEDGPFNSVDGTIQIDVVVRQRQQLQQAELEPTEQAILDALRAELPGAPAYSTRDRLVPDDEMRRGIHSLPIYTAQHEGYMLLEARTVHLNHGLCIQLPACDYGPRCVGRTEMQNVVGMPQGGFTLMRAMSADEWDALCTRGVLPVQRPGSFYPCVLCHRYYVTKFAIQRQHIQTLSYRLNVDPESQIVQYWSNAVDQEGGYRKPFVYHPHSDTVMVEPLMRFNTNLLQAVRGTPLNPDLWHVKQVDAVHWTPPQLPTPTPGETMAHF